MRANISQALPEVSRAPQTLRESAQEEAVSLAWINKSLSALVASAGAGIKLGCTQSEPGLGLCQVI